MMEKKLADAVDRVAESSGLSAKGKSVAAKAQTLAARGKAAAARAPSLAVKGLLAHYLISGLCIGSMLLVLWGGFTLLSRSIDPAAAAVLLGLGVATLLVGGGLYATRAKDD